ncbi:MAG: DUF2971 domain-containing protein [Nitrososphaerales archaeon]
MDDTSEELLESLGEPGLSLYHYTTLQAAVEHILPSGRIMMNPFSKMRDPRESKFLNPVGANDPQGSATLDSTRRFTAIYEKACAVKDLVKVFSLTRDDLSRREHDVAVFGRGFAHPRLWEQYADRHRGVCLCFDKEKLAGVMLTKLAKHAELEHGEVVYRDGPIDPQAYTFSLADTERYTNEEIVDRMIRAGMHELFFTKVKDWEAEVEYRFVVPTRDTKPLYVPARGALRAVMLGEETSEHYTPAILRILEEPGTREIGIRVLRVRWGDGAPFLRDPTRPGYD